MIDLVNSLGSTMQLPLTIGWETVTLSKNAGVQQLARGGGVSTGRNTYQPRSLTLSGSIYTGTPEDNNDLYDSIKQFLDSVPVEVDRGDGRHVIAYPTKFECKGLDGDRELELKISMVSPVPFFYGAEILTAYTGVTTSSTETLNVDGTYHTLPFITVSVTSANASGLSIGVEDYLIEITGDLVSGDEIEIDCDTFTVTLNGSSIIGSVGDDFLVDGIKLVPGNNSITMGITGTADFTFLHRNVWL